MTSSDSILVKTEGEKFLPDSFLNWLQIPYEWMTSRVMKIGSRLFSQVIANSVVLKTPLG
jgi:hypothetical protein